MEEFLESAFVYSLSELMELNRHDVELEEIKTEDVVVEEIAF